MCVNSVPLWDYKCYEKEKNKGEQKWACLREFNVFCCFFPPHRFYLHTLISKNVCAYAIVRLV